MLLLIYQSLKSIEFSDKNILIRIVCNFRGNLNVFYGSILSNVLKITNLEKLIKMFLNYNLGIKLINIFSTLQKRV